MKICIIQFSPSGNTKSVSVQIKNELEKRGRSVQLIDITGDKEVFEENNIPGFLKNNIQPHDVLLVGSPVYAHHLQYHMADMLKCLPKPDAIWGKYAIPYVTYGGISSGIALKEAGELLAERGRIIPAALKVSLSHRMTRAFLDEEFNKNTDTRLIGKSVLELVEVIMLLEKEGHCNSNNLKTLSYNGFATYIKAQLIFNEKKWHAERYPRIFINTQTCNNCGTCVNNCPVLHLKKTETGIIEKAESPCIHCLNCVSGCKTKSIKLLGDLEKGRAFMLKMIEKKGNKEKPETEVINCL